MNKLEETSADFLNRLGTNGQKWAQEFIKMFNGEVVGEGRIDEGLMIGWFANAIMRGWDEANWKRSKENQELQAKFVIMKEALEKIADVEAKTSLPGYMALQIARETLRKI